MLHHHKLTYWFLLLVSSCGIILLASSSVKNQLLSLLASPSAEQRATKPEQGILYFTRHEESYTSDAERVLSLLPSRDLMPFPGCIRDREELGKGEWVIKLHNFLSTLNKSVSPHVNMVFGDYKHRYLVLNWIKAALDVIEPPLHNVLVLSRDNLLCELLVNRTIPVACVAVSENSLFHENDTHQLWLKGLMVRAVVLRLINHWGYDVASYDCDAVILKNPQSLFDMRPDVTIFSAAATFPTELSQKWGFTLCAGSVVLKATPATDALWRHISMFSDIVDEQLCLNWALVEMNTVWERVTSADQRCSVAEGWEGRGDHEIVVHVFPPHLFCRAACCTQIHTRQDLYSVHPLESKTNLESKVASLKRLKAWFSPKQDK